MWVSKTPKGDALIIDDSLWEGGKSLTPPDFGDAGYDVHCFIPEDTQLVIEPGECVPVDTGIRLEFSPKYVCFVKPRSGLSVGKPKIKGGSRGPPTDVLAGVVDSTYRNTLKVALYNLSNETSLRLERGDRIGQLVFLPVVRFSSIRQSSELSRSKRGQKGFGSSGMSSKKSQ